MRKVLYWAVFGVVVFALLIWNGVVWELGREFLFAPEVRLPPYIPWASNWHVRHRGQTLVYEIGVAAESIEPARLKEFERLVVKNVCAQAAIVGEMKRGAVLEHTYLNPYGKALATVVVRAGDCER